jgi:Condensation domain
VPAGCFPSAPVTQPDCPIHFSLTKDTKRAFSCGFPTCVTCVDSADLTSDPLIRATLLRRGDDHLLLDLHHLIADGWSLDLLIRELAALYIAAVGGAPAALPELPIQYADFTIWQREQLQGEYLAAELAFWREQLRDVPPTLELPFDFAPPHEPDFHGAR